MAATKVLTGSEVLTGGPWDAAIISYAPTLQLQIFSPFAASTIISNALINTKTSPVYEIWSTSAPFDPAAPQINLSFKSNSGSTLTTTRNGSSTTMSLISGNKNINFNGSTKISGTNVDSKGNVIDGTTSTAQNVSYSDTKGTTNQFDDTNSYYNGTLNQTTKGNSDQFVI